MSKSPIRPSDEKLRAFLAPHRDNTLVVPEVFTVELHIDPTRPEARDDAYILLDEDGAEHQRRTVVDDSVPGDDRLTLVYTGLRRGLKYSLLIDEGREGKYYAFHDVLLEDLIAVDACPESTDAAGDTPEPQAFDDSLLDEDFLEPAPGAAGTRSVFELGEHPPTEGADEHIL